MDTLKSAVLRFTESCSLEQVQLSRNVKRFRGGPVFKAHRLSYHSILGSRVINKEDKVPRTGAFPLLLDCRLRLFFTEKEGPDPGGERCSPGQKSRAEHLNAKVEPLLT